MTTPQETPAAPPQLCTEPDFAALLERFVADVAPRLFALVEEADERLDARIIAWGMEFTDRAELVWVGRPIRGRFSCAERVREVFSFSHHGTLHLIWFNPAAATHRDQVA
ncbi:MAG: hypothetical protein JO115_09295 [Pseudonocardiales bacterium]|nr:hypothetical protein [Pseudonocardiales bacterium]